MPADTRCLTIWFQAEALLSAAAGSPSLPRPPAVDRPRWPLPRANSSCRPRKTVVEEIGDPRSALAGVAAVAARKFLGSADADWQAARPSAPYTPPQPAKQRSRAPKGGIAVDETAATRWRPRRAAA